MNIPFFVLPLAVHLVVVADGVPNWDVTKSCRGAPLVGGNEHIKDRYTNCLEFEQRTHEELAKNWTKYPAADRAGCIQSIKWFSPTYSELLTCIEMKRDLKNINENEKEPADAKPRL